MLLRTESANPDLLARHLAERLRQHSGDPVDVLVGLKAELPKPYHAQLQELERRVRQGGSLAKALTDLPDSCMQQLGQLLQQPSTDVTQALSHWLQQRTKLHRISVLIAQAIHQQLMYFLALLTIFSGISLTWLMYVAPTYNELFRELAGDAKAPSFSQLLLALADSDHALTLVLKLLLLVMPIIAGISVLLVKHQLKRLRQGRPLLFSIRNWPLFRHFSAIQALFGTGTNEQELTALLTTDEQLELKLARQGNYLTSQLDALRTLPESVLAVRVAAPLQRLTQILTVLLWLIIGCFLVAAYQPIFSLGAAI